jgi:predicted PurR-regulated permease PerM
MTDLRPPAPVPNAESPAASVPPAASETPFDPAAPSRRPLKWRSYLWVAGAAVVVYFALRWLGPVLTPFLIGAILAYLGRPMVEAALARGVPRAAATTIVVMLFGLVLAGIFVVLVPLIQAEVALAAKQLPDLLAQASARVSPWLEERFGITMAFSLDSLRTFVTENAESAQSLSLRLLSGVKTGGLIAVSVLVNLALIPVVMFFLLRDWKMIGERLGELAPRHWSAKAATIVHEIDDVLAEYLRGQLMVMAVLATFYAVGLSIAGLDRAIAIGILTGLLVFIPYVGFGLGLALGIASALLQWSGWPAFLAVVAVYGIGQLLENYVLVPWLIGERIGLHPLAVIFALLAFGHLFGFAGILLALPASAALLVGLRHVRGAYLDSPIYRGSE